MNKEYFEIFVDTGKDYYLEILNDHEQGKKIQFNSMAFFYGLGWFLFRKMYIETFILLIPLVLVGAMEQFILNQLGLTNAPLISFLHLIIILLIAGMLGYFGNWIYIAHVNRKLNSLTEKYNFDEILLKSKIQKQGGTSFIAIGIWFTLIISMLIIFYSQILQQTFF